MTIDYQHLQNKVPCLYCTRLWDKDDMMIWLTVRCCPVCYMDKLKEDLKKKNDTIS
jgi:hypothetical protein